MIDFGFPRRIIYDRTDDFNNLDGLSFFSRYRLTKPTVINVLVQAENDFEFRNVNRCVSPMIQLLTCLKSYASGSFLISSSYSI
ncbi:hypothetical protein QE152_g38754 [Popillia japonica]|uniref:Uncharacterized protein n=1 Tax=Popillia japonica TaxID=7064 RepID=A0AAW1HVY6_POPJA